MRKMPEVHDYRSPMAGVYYWHEKWLVVHAISDMLAVNRMLEHTTRKVARFTILTRNGDAARTGGKNSPSSLRYRDSLADLRPARGPRLRVNFDFVLLLCRVWFGAESLLLRGNCVSWLLSSLGLENLDLKSGRSESSHAWAIGSYELSSMDIN